MDCRCFSYSWVMGCLVLVLLNPAAGLGTGGDWRVFGTPFLPDSPGHAQAPPDAADRHGAPRSSVARSRPRGLPFILGFRFFLTEGSEGPSTGLTAKGWTAKPSVHTLTSRHDRGHTGSFYTGRRLVRRSPADEKPATTSPPGMAESCHFRSAAKRSRPTGQITSKWSINRLSFGPID